MNHCISLTVNGVRRDLLLSDPRVTLLDLLREQLHLTGTKKGCDRGQCGACTVLVGGRRINSCLALAISYDGADVLTIEGVAQGDRLHPVQEAFIAHDALKCGFCTPGQIMSAIGLIAEGHAGDDPERVRALIELEDRILEHALANEERSRVSAMAVHEGQRKQTSRTTSKPISVK